MAVEADFETINSINQNDRSWPTRAGRNRFTLDVVSSADSLQRWIPSIRSVALSSHDAAPNFTLQEFGIRLP